MKELENTCMRIDDIGNNIEKRILAISHSIEKYKIFNNTDKNNFYEKKALNFTYYINLFINKIKQK